MMKIGLHMTTFEVPGGNANIRQAVKDVAQYADETGFASLSVMDHFFQIGMNGAPERNMLEGYSVLNYLAAVTERIQLLTMVTGVIYRHPGILAKQVTTLDILSGGRAMLGIGAAWNEQESHGLGIPFPPLAERFERLEETVQIVLQMWSGEVKPFEGKHYQLTQTLNNPMPLSQPHPPLLIGGGGEKKTLRMVAQYADACNLFLFAGTEAVQHKLDVLKAHCDTLGRNFDEIELTATTGANPATQSASEIIEMCRQATALGFDEVMLMLPNEYDMHALEVLGKEVIPAAAEF
jgi:F420-dependent oxidoreductase-like protein